MVLKNENKMLFTPTHIFFLRRRKRKIFLKYMILVGARARAHKVACEEDDQDKKLISS